MVDVPWVRVRNQCLCLTQLFDSGCQYYVSLLQSQSFDCDNTFYGLKYVLYMGQKQGKFPGFDHGLNNEKRIVGQKHYLVPGIVYHQNDERRGQYIY